MNRREFTVANEYTYDHRSPLRWLASHIVRYPVLLITFLVTTVGMAGSQSMSALMVGRAFDTVLEERCGGADRCCLAGRGGLYRLWLVRHRQQHGDPCAGTAR